MPLSVERSVADLLGISAQRAALHAITAGDASTSAFTALDDDWDVEERALAVLARFGLPSGRPHWIARSARCPAVRRCWSAWPACCCAGPRSRLLDEPTNNLDRDSRDRLYDAVETWPGVLIVVSHDRALLDRVERIAELRDGVIRTYGGTFTAYEQQLAAELETAQRLVRAAEGVVAQERRQLIETQTKLARRKSYARTAEIEKRVPKIIANARKRRLRSRPASTASCRNSGWRQARTALAAAEEAVRDDDRVRIELPATAVPAGRTILQTPG